MKTFLFLLINVVFFTSTGSAQKIKVAERTANLGGSVHNALAVPVFEADEKTILKEWKSLLRHYGAKSAMLGTEPFGDNAVIKDISNNTIDIYWRVEKGASNTIVMASYDLGGAFLSASTHSKEYRVIETIMYDFALNLTRKTIATQQRDAQRESEKRDRKLNRLVSDNQDLHKDIENHKLGIKTAEDNIVLNITAQKEAKELLDAQNKTLEEIKAKAKTFE